MKLTDERLIEFIKNKHNEKNFDYEKFLNPEEKYLRDANQFSDIKEIVEKIKLAISDKKKILVYGDYDSDGICSSTILYLFLKSQGADVDVFIPNRFENGYGISVDAIDEILYSYAPELIITVDLGITAVEEVEILKQEGTDVIITDHHIPLEEVPDCLILDPKYNNSAYGFDALCGAGVAMKLVEAIAGRGEANKYLDFAGIATVGDIVPLVDENRIIAKLGIDKINKGECHKSITFLKNKLEISEISSSDISFKIVPRLNACGRMDSAIKVFDFLISEDENELNEKYQEIESDNNLRLACIDKGNKIIDKQLNKINTDEPTVLISGDFHEGIIGILASRVCHEFNKPTIIFTETENGTLKGSGRSIASIDLHKIVSELNDGLLENFGGHKMAIGVEILPEAFETFKTRLNQKVREISDTADFLITGGKYDILITEDDLSQNFLSQMNMLEPFGCENEKPVLAIKQGKMGIEPISEKAFKHYRCFTANNNAIIGFNFYKNCSLIKSESEKLIGVDMSTNTYKGKTSISIQAKSVNIIEPKQGSDCNMNNFLSSFYNLYYAKFDFSNKDKYFVLSKDELCKIINEKFSESEFGTIVIARNDNDYEIIKKLNLEKYITSEPYKNSQNAVLCSEFGVYTLDAVKNYKNIIFLGKIFENEHLYFSQKLNVYEPNECEPTDIVLSKERQVFGVCYKQILNFANLKSNDIIDLANKLSIKDGMNSSAQYLFCLIVFMELNFIEFDDILNNIKVLKSKKMELSSSVMFNEVRWVMAVYDQNFISSVKKNYPKHSEMILNAYYYADKMHSGILRKSGEPYIIHPVGVAQILIDNNMDYSTIMAGLLHDVVEDTDQTIEDIERLFGKTVAKLVDGVTKIDELRRKEFNLTEADSIKHLLLAMGDDVRVIFIKLADRLNNMRSIEFLRRERQLANAKETQELFIPIAERIGVRKLRTELQELTFKCMYPEEYNAIKTEFDRKYEKRKTKIEEIERTLKKVLDDAGVKNDITGWPEHYYSIFKRKKYQGIGKIYNFMLFKVIVPTEQDCYRAMGLFHKKYKPVPGQIKDHIADPKKNGYRSIHSVMVSEDSDITFKVMIRTEEMDKTCEYGVSSSWQTKDSDKDFYENYEKNNNLKDIIFGEETVNKNSVSFIDAIKMDLLPNVTWVLTPKFKPICVGADNPTAIDFAYALHTNIGNNAVGAIINGKKSSLATVLRNGDVVEIVLSKEDKSPSRNWLFVAKTSSARKKIREFINKNTTSDFINAGKKMLESELEKIGYSVKDLENVYDKINEEFRFASEDDMFASIGYKSITINQILKYLKTNKEELKESSPVVVLDDDDFSKISLPKCCCPILGDEIVGVKSKTGITVHAKNCTNLRNADSSKFVNVAWKTNPNCLFDVNLKIVAKDRLGFGWRLLKLISDGHYNMTKVVGRKVNVSDCEFNICASVKDINELNNLIDEIKSLDDIKSITRYFD